MQKNNDLWPGWIPRSSCSLLSAPPGFGKSFFLLDILRRLLCHEAMPDGYIVNQEKKNFIWVDVGRQLSEHYHRLNKWEAASLLHSNDLSRIYPLEMDKRCRKMKLDLTMPKYRERLIEMTVALKPEWIIVDYLAPLFTHYTKSLEIFDFLNELAAGYKVAITATNLKLFNTIQARAQAIITIQGHSDLPTRIVQPIKPRRLNPLLFKFQSLPNDGAQLIYESRE